MLYKRGSMWWVRIARRGQKPIRCSAGTEDRQKAQEYHDKLANDSWRQGKLGEKPRKLWGEAILRYLDHSRKRSLKDDEEMLSRLRDYLSDVEPLEVIAGVQNDGVSEKWDWVLGRLKAEGLSDARLNRYTALVRTVLRHHGFLPRLRTYAEAPRDRVLEPEEVPQILAGMAPWAQDCFLFSLATGVRKGNLLALKWSWIKMDRRVIEIPSEEFKQGYKAEIPLSAYAIEVLKRQIGKDGERVFPVTEASLRGAWERVRPEGVRWHDIRRTWATWLRRAGVSVEDIKAAGDWKTLAVVERTYAKIRPTQLLSVVDQLGPELHKLSTPQRIDVLQVGAGKGI
jgi:integrase